MVNPFSGIIRCWWTGGALSKIIWYKRKVRVIVVGGMKEEDKGKDGSKKEESKREGTTIGAHGGVKWSCVCSLAPLSCARYSQRQTSLRNTRHPSATQDIPLHRTTLSAPSSSVRGPLHGDSRDVSTCLRTLELGRHSILCHDGT